MVRSKRVKVAKKKGRNDNLNGQDGDERVDIREDPSDSVSAWRRVATSAWTGVAGYSCVVVTATSYTISQDLKGSKTQPLRAEHESYLWEWLNSVREKREWGERHYYQRLDKMHEMKYYELHNFPQISKMPFSQDGLLEQMTLGNAPASRRTLLVGT